MQTVQTDFTLYTLHSTLCTPHFALFTLHSTLGTLHSTLFTLHSTLCTLHSTTLPTLHFTLRTLHSTLYTSHSTLYTLHFTLYTLHSTLYTLHYSLHTWHCTVFCIQQSTLHLYGTRGKMQTAFGFVDCVLIFLKVAFRTPRWRKLCHIDAVLWTRWRDGTWFQCGWSIVLLVEAWEEYILHFGW